MKSILKTNTVSLSKDWLIPIFKSNCFFKVWSICNNSQFSWSRCFSIDWFNSS